MIARTWSGRVPRRHADGFEEHLMATGVAQSADLPDHGGAQILRKDAGDEVEFVLITYWRTWQAVRRFAGADVSAAVLYPGDEKYELIPSKTVDHYQVVFTSHP